MNLKRNLLFFSSLFSILGLFFITPVFAATSSVGIVENKNFNFPWENSNFSTTSLGGLVAFFYRYALGIVGVAALIMIIYGGVKYTLSAGSAGGKKEALDIIKNAIFGLVLLLVSYILLNTINPQIVGVSNVDTQINSLNKQNVDNEVILHDDANDPLTTSSINPCIICATENQQAAVRKCFTNQEAYTKLKNVTIQSSGGCSDPKNPKCTSLEQIPCGVVDYLNRMAESCKQNGKTYCRIIVTGGTEVGHKSHGLQKPNIDLSYYGGLTGKAATDQAVALAKVINAFGDSGFLEISHGSGSKFTFAEGEPFCMADTNDVIKANGAKDISSCKNIDHFHIQFRVNVSNGYGCDSYQPTSFSQFCK